MVTTDLRQQVLDMIQTADGIQLQAVYNYFKPSKHKYTAEEIKFFHDQLEEVNKGELKTYTLAEVKAKVKEKFAIAHGK